MFQHIGACGKTLSVSRVLECAQNVFACCPFVVFLHRHDDVTPSWFRALESHVLRVPNGNGMKKWSSPSSLSSPSVLVWFLAASRKQHSCLHLCCATTSFSCLHFHLSHCSFLIIFPLFHFCIFDHFSPVFIFAFFPFSICISSPFLFCSSFLIIFPLFHFSFLIIFLPFSFLHFPLFHFCILPFFIFHF